MYRSMTLLGNTFLSNLFKDLAVLFLKGTALELKV